MSERKARSKTVSESVFRLCMRAWSIAIGLIAIFACATHFFVPGESPVDVQLGNLAHVYYIVYGLAGLFILIGLFRRRNDLDGLGLALLIGGLLINLVAVIATIGWVQSVPSIGSWFALTVGAVGRLLVVSKLIQPYRVPDQEIKERVRHALEDELEDRSAL